VITRRPAAIYNLGNGS